MNLEEPITEKIYPIATVWIFKSPLIMTLISIVAFIFGYYFPVFLFMIPVLLVANPLTRRNFHFSVGNKFLEIKQGILSKGERHLPYGVIQNVLVKQDIFDRIFRIASLSIENASQGAGSAPPEKKFLGMTLGTKNYKQPWYTEGFLGYGGNKVNIPGLKKQDAEALKEVILQKVKENPIEDSQSGL